ncbi:MAG: hypothetical protein RR315_00440 [Oscillospiraceae bacterium]
MLNMLLNAPPPTAMQNLLSDLTLIVTSAFSWVSTVSSTIVGTPILLLTTGFFVLGGAVGIFSRLLSRN